MKKKIDEVYVVLLVAVAIILVSIYTRKSQDIEASDITEILIGSGDLSFATGGVVNIDKLNNFNRMDYDRIKNLLDIRGDFCLYMEDEKGNIILSKGSEKLGQGCKG